jgi:hypothetical protein
LQLEEFSANSSYLLMTPQEMKQLPNTIISFRFRGGSSGPDRGLADLVFRFRPSDRRQTLDKAETGVETGHGLERIPMLMERRMNATTARRRRASH